MELLKVVDAQEAVDLGLVQEANRLFFHPRGVHLWPYLNGSGDGQANLALSDEREDVGGGWYLKGQMSAEKAEASNGMADERVYDRIRTRGSLEQSLPGQPPLTPSPSLDVNGNRVCPFCYAEVRKSVKDDSSFGVDLRTAEERESKYGNQWFVHAYDGYFHGIAHRPKCPMRLGGSMTLSQWNSGDPEKSASDMMDELTHAYIVSIYSGDESKYDVFMYRASFCDKEWRFVPEGCVDFRPECNYCIVDKESGEEIPSPDNPGGTDLPPLERPRRIVEVVPTTRANHIDVSLTMEKAHGEAAKAAAVPREVLGGEGEDVTV